MSPSTIIRRLFTTIPVALALAALAAPAALASKPARVPDAIDLYLANQTRSAPDAIDRYLRNLDRDARSVYPDDRYGIRAPGEAPTAVGIYPDDRAVVRAPGGAPAAVGIYPDDRRIVRAPGDLVFTPATPIATVGFDWGDMGVGVGSAFGVMLLAGSGLLLARHARRRVPSHQ